MSLPSAPSALALTCALAAAAPGAAGAGGAVFDFYVTGIRLGTMTMELEETDGDYEAASRIETAGLAGALADFYFDGQATGSIDGAGRVVPSRFVANSKSPRAARHTEIEFEDGTPISVSVEPPRSSAPDPATQGGTLDPVSAGYAVLRDRQPEQLCDASVEIFDGSRRSRLAVGPPVRGEDGLVCAGTYARLEGEEHSLTSDREFAFELHFRENGEGVAQLERVESPTKFGLAVLERRD
jgi:hypothetical protein